MYVSLYTIGCVTDHVVVILNHVEVTKKFSSSRALFFIFILLFLPFIFLLCKVAYFISFKAINPVSLMPYFLFAFIKAAPLHINYSEKTRYPAGTPLHFFILFFLQLMYNICIIFLVLLIKLTNLIFKAKSYGSTDILLYLS